MSWGRYVIRHAGGDVNRVIAEKVGITEPSVARWKSGKTKAPDAEPAAAFARAYGRPVLEAFIAAGFLSADEAGEQPIAPSVAPALDELSDDDLVSEVSRRLARTAGESGGTVTDLPDRPPRRPAGGLSGRKAGENLQVPSKAARPDPESK